MNASLAGRAIRVGVNGRFLSQKLTGVQRYAHEIVAGLERRYASGRFGDSRFTLGLPANAGDRAGAYPAFGVPVVGRRSGYPWEQLEFPGLPADLLLNLCNLAPVRSRASVLCIHDANTFTAPSSYGWRYRAVQRIALPLLARRAAVLCTVSHASAASIAAVSGVEESRIVVAPNGHEHALRWRPEASTLAIDSLTRRPFVVMLGSRAPHKNLALVRQIAPALAEKGIDVVVVGDAGSVFAGGSGDDGGLLCTGRIADDDIARLFGRALCLVFPSFVEGFGLPIVEAMALGCPVVASNLSCIPEICGDAALLRSPHAPQEWIEAVAHLASDPARREALVRAGHERVKLFSWERSADIYAGIIESFRAR
jgi:glycosyltransferase involved in cell wall biosynthesis